MKDEKYHHGNLKQVLLNLGLSELELDGANLSLSHLAKMAGVSRNAPFRHFPSKEDFLNELVNEGFKKLYGKLESAMAENKKNRKSLRQSVGLVLLELGEKSPALYRLMHSKIMCAMDHEKHSWPTKVLRLIAEVTSGKKNPLPEDYVSVIPFWAYVHGLISLRIDKLYPPHLPQPDWKNLLVKA